MKHESKQVINKVQKYETNKSYKELEREIITIEKKYQAWVIDGFLANKAWSKPKKNVTVKSVVIYSI